jgi:hypothetical protein
MDPINWQNAGDGLPKCYVDQFCRNSSGSFAIDIQRRGIASGRSDRAKTRPRWQSITSRPGNLMTAR